MGRGQRVEDADRLERGQQFGQALRQDRLVRLVVDGMAGDACCQRTDDDLACLRALLQSRGHVDRVAGDEELSMVADSCDHFARVDADAEREPHARVPTVVDDGIAHRQGGTNGAFSVVLMQPGNAEHDHDGIADELLDRSTVRFGDGLHPLEVTRHHTANQLWIVARADRGGVDDIRKQDTDDFAFLGHGGAPWQPCDAVNGAGRGADRSDEGLTRIRTGNMVAPSVTDRGGLPLWTCRRGGASTGVWTLTTGTAASAVCRCCLGVLSASR